MAAQFDLRLRDGTQLADIAGVASDKTVTRRLGRPTSVSFRVPSDHDLIWTPASDGRPFLCSGFRQMMVTLDDPGLYANCIVWALEDDGDEDMAYTRVTCYDPRMMWVARPARDPDGDFTDPTFMRDFDTGPAILQAILDASENAGSGPPEDAEGSLFLDYTTGNWPGGGVSLAGAPTNFPMYIADIVGLLQNSGQLDVDVVPTDNGAEMGRVDTYHGNMGVDRTATVHFDYATGSFNASNLSRTEDMTETRNKIWRYLGPREDLQHWRANVTGDDPELPGNVSGGAGIGGAIPTSSSYAGGPLGDLIQDSRDGIGVLMEIQLADDQGSEASTRPLQRRLWQMESLFRAMPRRTINLTPARGAGGIFNAGDFDVGDLIAINVGLKAREAVVNMVQRVYGLTVEIDDEAVESLILETSPDQDQL